MVFRVHFRSVLVMFGRMQRMPMGDLGMVRGLFVVPCPMVSRGFAVMFGGVLVMFGRLVVMIVDIVAVH